jgi:hypothetical protein
MTSTVTHPLVKIDPDKGTIEGGIKTLSEYFGRQPGQSLKEFGAEIQALTLDDKVQLVGGIRDGSLTY